jgi:hypothetical protein
MQSCPEARFARIHGSITTPCRQDSRRVAAVSTVRTARVIEDRGPIGVGGRQLVRVEIVDPDLGDDAPRFEIPAEQVQAA